MHQAFRLDLEVRSSGERLECEPLSSTMNCLIAMLWKLSVDTNYEAAMKLDPLMQEKKGLEAQLARIEPNMNEIKSIQMRLRRAFKEDEQLAEQLSQLQTRAKEYYRQLARWSEVCLLLRKGLRGILASHVGQEHPDRRKIRELFIHHFR